jgi:hypothetical protein
MKPNPIRPAKRDANVNLTLTSAQLEALIVQARIEERSMSAVVRRAVQEYLDRVSQQEPEPTR